MATCPSLAAIAICVLAASASTGFAQVPPARADARARISAVEARLDSVSRHADADANAALFTEDAVVSLGGLEDVRGRDALLAAMRGYYDRNAVRIHQLRGAELEVYGATAYERGTYLYVAGPRGQEPTTERGRYSAVWRRGADGKWRIYRYIENLLPTGTSGP